ncbi:hypothetical protein NCS52_01525800 [Fusarium sp. LHS14.1]|nr:hypothetical protein NCS52_01525800 [Fusarium sp. LHS14.1]
MGEPFERFKLSTAAEQLAEQAGHELNSERPLPRKVGEDGVEIGAKGLQYDWLPRHQQLWVQVSKDRQIKAWSGNPSIRIDKLVIRLEKEYSLQTAEGMMSIVVPIDQQFTKVAFLCPKGSVEEAKGVVQDDWQPGFGFCIREEVTIGAIEKDITFILVKVKRTVEVPAAI